MSSKIRSGGHVNVDLDGVGRVRSSSTLARELPPLALSPDANDRIYDQVLDHIADLAKRGPDLADALYRALQAGRVRVEYWAPDGEPGCLRILTPLATGTHELMRIDDPAAYGVEGDRQ